MANLTRRDGDAFLALASTLHIETSVAEHELAEASCALSDLRAGLLGVRACWCRAERVLLNLARRVRYAADASRLGILPLAES